MNRLNRQQNRGTVWKLRVFETTQLPKDIHTQPTLIKLQPHNLLTVKLTARVQRTFIKECLLQTVSLSLTNAALFKPVLQTQTRQIQIQLTLSGEHSRSSPVESRFVQSECGRQRLIQPIHEEITIALECMCVTIATCLVSFQRNFTFNF